MDERQRDIRAGASLLDRVIRFCLENKLVVALVVLLVVGWGVMVAPFDWDVAGLPRSPVPVDAIPDIGENQQIVFTEWMGRSPQDVEGPGDLSANGVADGASRRQDGAQLLDLRLSRASTSLPGTRGLLLVAQPGAGETQQPAGGNAPGRRPAALGPDATGLGRSSGNARRTRSERQSGRRMDLDELRTVQDMVRSLRPAGRRGVSEVASGRSFVREYQIDVDPDAMRAYGVGLEDIVKAVKSSNIDVGARTIEINKVEYVIRSLGFVKHLSDIEQTVVKANDNVPIYVKDIAKVSTGPALRRGALDKGGAEAVGGVVVVRYGYNPLAAIQHVKEKIEELAPGLPEKTLADGTVSKVTIVPFYDRTGLIYETLGTLDTALTEEVLVTIIVVIVMVLHLRSSVLISALLPLAILMCFIAMKHFGVDANIVALSGIAIAVGTMVDMGIVICENILRRLDEAQEGENPLEVVYQASCEVGSAVVTAVATTIAASFRSSR
jgi:Cu(I)/Ag(I) efflux system membrane protein CusA/SilA